MHKRRETAPSIIANVNDYAHVLRDARGVCGLTWVTGLRSGPTSINTTHRSASPLTQKPGPYHAPSPDLRRAKAQALSPRRGLLRQRRISKQIRARLCICSNIGTTPRLTSASANSNQVGLARVTTRPQRISTDFRPF